MSSSTSLSYYWKKTRKILWDSNLFVLLFCRPQWWNGQPWKSDKHSSAGDHHQEKSSWHPFKPDGHSVQASQHTQGWRVRHDLFHEDSHTNHLCSETTSLNTLICPMYMFSKDPSDLLLEVMCVFLEVKLSGAKHNTYEVNLVVVV